jgi:hypothetical protein
VRIPESHRRHQALRGRPLARKSAHFGEGLRNYLIDPARPDFASIEVSEPEPLELGPRITGVQIYSPDYLATLVAEAL